MVKTLADVLNEFRVARGKRLLVPPRTSISHAIFHKERGKEQFLLIEFVL